MADHDSQPQVVTVVGNATASAPADTASITIGVSVLGATAAAASQDATAAANQLHAALSGAGIATSDLTTADYSLFAEHDHRGGQPVLRGYRVNNSVVVTVRDLDQLPTVLREATEAAGNATTINGISFSISDDTDLRATARAAAWADAVRAATQLAELASTELGPAVSISEGTPTVPVMRPMMRRAVAAEAAPPIEGGDTSVAVSLTVSFALGAATA